MNKLLLALMLAPRLSMAATKTNAQAVNDMVPYLFSCSSTTIGTTAADLSGNTLALSTSTGVSKLLIENLSAGTTEFFGSDNTVTAGPATTAGFALYPKTSSNPALPNFMWFPISVVQQWFGIADTNLTPLEVCKLR